MRFHGMAVQQERLSGRGYERYEPFPAPDVPTPECVAQIFVAWAFPIDVMVFTNLITALFLLLSLTLSIYS